MFEVGWVVFLEEFEEEEANDASEGSSDEEEGIGGFGDVGFLGEIGDDGTVAAREQSEIEEDETVEDEVGGGFNDGFGRGFHNIFLTTAF